MIRDLLGFCPMGCGQTLHATEGGFITCLAPGCERPAAVTELLSLRDAIEHRVTLGVAGFQVVHPLRERFGDLIARCPLDDYLRSLAGPPDGPGTFLVEQQCDGQWVFTPWTVR